ncbi:hypothetical protein WA158_007684 [Blastocystis sp. Blastoise]
MATSTSAVAKMTFLLNSFKGLAKSEIAKELTKITKDKNYKEFYSACFQALQLKKQNILFLGAPGAGKGTYSRAVSEIMDIPVFGSGDYIKSHIRKDTPFGQLCEDYVNKGQLVPDNIVIDPLLEAINQPQYTTGLILDGFPRNLNQVDAIEKSKEITLAINFRLPTEILIRKMLGRRICPKCGKGYNVADIHSGDILLPPLLPKCIDRCDICNEQLIQRSDDNEVVIKDRMKNIYTFLYFNILREFDVKLGMADLPEILKLILIENITN